WTKQKIRTAVNARRLYRIRNCHNRSRCVSKHHRKWRCSMAELNPLAETAPADLDDQELVKQVRNGKREALETLITRHQKWIYNIVLRMLYHPHDAEDATQEILI